MAEEGVRLLGKDGNAIAGMPFSDVDRISFTDNSVEIKNLDNTTVTAAYGDIDRIVFFGEVSSLGNLPVKSEIAVWPVRVESYVNISGLEPGTSVRVYDLAGTLHASATAGEETLSINLSALQSGIYLVNFLNQSAKIIKQ